MTETINDPLTHPLTHSLTHSFHAFPSNFQAIQSLQLVHKMLQNIEIKFWSNFVDLSNCKSGTQFRISKDTSALSASISVQISTHLQNVYNT